MFTWIEMDTIVNLFFLVEIDIVIITERSLKSSLNDYYDRSWTARNDYDKRDSNIVFSLRLNSDSHLSA